MQQHLGRLDGVSKVEVSLVDGKVSIYPKTDAKLSPALILKATYDSGVTVAEMTATASGQLVNDPAQGLLFQISGDQVFEVSPNEMSEKIKGPKGQSVPATLRARLYKKPPRKQQPKAPSPLRVEILEILRKG